MMTMTATKGIALFLFLTTAAASGIAALPELMKGADGREAKTVADWEGFRRSAVAETILPVEYGRLPAVPKKVEVAEIGRTQAGQKYLPWLPGGNRRQLKVWCDMDGEPVTFCLQVWGPAGRNRTKHPLLIEGDGCWSCLSREIIAAAVKRGWVVAQFNRCEVARDNNSATERALLKWAWTYHRAIDALLQAEPRVDPACIAISGHSRGGKTVLLAGATDARIAAVGDNCSGQGGSGPCRRIPEPMGESIKNITGNFPYWFTPTWHTWAGRETELPFDQHFLLSLIAPRKLFTRCAKDDTWANPPGAKLIVEAARPAWELYGKGGNIRYSLREGGHAHTLEDFMEFLDFIEEPSAKKEIK